MDDFLQRMGTRIMLRRKELKLSQEAVAEKAGVTPQTISTAERGTKALRPENIVKICSALDLSPNYVLLGEISFMSSDERSSKIAKLTPLQMQYLERIVDNYVAAVALSEREM